MGVTQAPPRSDSELVDAVRAGDIRAFADLYREHVAAVRRVAYRLVGNPDVTADVVQDTFSRALVHLPELREPDRFRPWLLSIARRAATDQLRARRRVTSFDETDDEALASSGPGPEAFAELRELVRQVQSCMAGLSKRDATAVAMVTHLGFTPVEVADSLGVTPGAAKVIVHRARRRLRHALMLELMVRQPSLGCSEFRTLLAENSLSASRHLDHCEACKEAAAMDVVTFQLDAELPPQPAPL